LCREAKPRKKGYDSGNVGRPGLEWGRGHLKVGKPANWAIDQKRTVLFFLVPTADSCTEDLRI
jgi:hypothetical protein